MDKETSRTPGDILNVAQKNDYRLSPRLQGQPQLPPQTTNGRRGCGLLAAATAVLVSEDSEV